MTTQNGPTTDGAVVRVGTGANCLDHARSLTSAARDAAETASVAAVGSTGVTGLDPLVALTADGATAFYAAPSADRLRTLVSELEEDGVSTDAAASNDALAVVDHGADATTLPTPEAGPLSVGRRRVLGRCGWVVPGALDDYDEFATQAVQNEPEEADARVRETGLLGRGRGDASVDDPVIDEWDRARDVADGESDDDRPGERDPVLVVNANESDQRNQTDRLLVESAPVDVVDGALAVAELVGVDDVVFYLNESDDLAAERLRTAVDAVADEFGVEERPQVVVGPDRYIAGEFTMALESLEGNDRLEARLRPPTPAEHGLYGRPTLVHTPRTVAQVRELLLSPDAFDADDADPGTRLLTVSGDVDAPATVELPTGGSLSTLRDAVDLDGHFKLAVVGGQFGGLTRSLDHPPSAPGLAGANLGTGGAVELFDDSHCAVATAGRRIRFAREENCGRCVPCREGTQQLTDLLRDIYGGDYQDGMIRELTRVMTGSSTCAFGRDAARTVSTAMNEFETEFHAHADGRCPSGECKKA